MPLTLPTILPPTKHNGIVVYLSNPDRFMAANRSLNSGPAFGLLAETLRANDVDPDSCIYTNDYAFGCDTQAVSLILGDHAAGALLQQYNNTLDAFRGYVVNKPRLARATATYAPIDCYEVFSHEPDSFNNDDDDDDDAASSNKDGAPTRRSSYLHWFRADIQKLLQPELHRTKTTYRFHTRRHITTDELIRWLNAQSNQHIYLDIETHPPTNTVQCMSFMTAGSHCFMVPCYTETGAATHNLTKLFTALTRAFQRNIIAGHNIIFDLSFLFHYHGVPYGPRIYDTMLAHHRAYPEVEKSLAHAISYWINAPFHKDTAGTFTPYNRAQYEKLLEYNARDVLCLPAIHASQMEEARRTPGLQASIEQAMTSAVPYMTAGFTGFNIDTKKFEKEVSGGEVTTAQLTRVLRVLIGSPDFNPASPQQVGRWLYDGLNYPILERTDSGAPGTGLKILYQLLVKFPENVALKLLIQFKLADKVVSMMGFTHYYAIEKR